MTKRTDAALQHIYGNYLCPHTFAEPMREVVNVAQKAAEHVENYPKLVPTEDAMVWISVLDRLISCLEELREVFKAHVATRAD